MLKFNKYTIGDSPEIHDIAVIKISFNITLDSIASIMINMIESNIHECHDDYDQRFDNLHKIRHKFTQTLIESELRSTVRASGRHRLDFGGWDSEVSDDEAHKAQIFIHQVVKEVYGLG